MYSFLLHMHQLIMIPKMYCSIKEIFLSKNAIQRCKGPPKYILGFIPVVTIIHPTTKMYHTFYSDDNYLSKHPFIFRGYCCCESTDHYIT